MSSYKEFNRTQIRNTLSDFYGKKPRPSKDRFYEKMMTALRHGKKDFLLAQEQVNELTKNLLTDEIIGIERTEGVFMVWLATQQEKIDYFKEWKKTHGNGQTEDQLYLKFTKEVNLIWH